LIKLDQSAAGHSEPAADFLNAKAAGIVPPAVFVLKVKVDMIDAIIIQRVYRKFSKPLATEEEGEGL
jgi:hypothetical protein